MKKKVKRLPACADCVQAFHFDRFVFKSDNKIGEEKKNYFQRYAGTSSTYAG